MPSRIVQIERALYGVIWENPGLTIPELAPKLMERWDQLAKRPPKEGQLRVKQPLVGLLARGQIRYEPVDEEEHLTPWSERRWYPAREHEQGNYGFGKR